MKKVFITGASGGIGGAIAREFAENGYFVGIGYNLGEERAEALARETGGVPIKFDVGNEAETLSAVKKFVSLKGGIDALVNCAGKSLPIKTVLDVSEEEYDEIFRVNTKGVFLACKAAIPYMLEKGGSIVNVSSMWGLGGASCEAVYSASKAAVIGFTKSLAKEYASAGIRVNAVAPGFIDTAMNAAIVGEDRKEALSEIPTGRFGRPDEVAKAVYFLVENGGFITGETLNISGGEVI